MANIKSAQKQNRKMIKHRARNRAAMARPAYRREDCPHRGRRQGRERAELVKKAVSIID